MGAGLEDSKSQENYHGEHRLLQKVRQRVPGRNRNAERPSQRAFASSPRPTAPTTTRRAIASMWREPISAPPGRNARPRAAIISRSSSTIRASTPRSTPTSSTTRTAKATPSSGRAAAKPMATERTAAKAPSETSGGVFQVSQPATRPKLLSFAAEWRVVRRARNGRSDFKPFFRAGFARRAGEAVMDLTLRFFATVRAASAPPCFSRRASSSDATTSGVTSATCSTPSARAIS